MANSLHSESRRLYSWWWDSHNSPKNSKWLQENLTDMDSKVKSMIKLIEEDADSFARRAEMYYKKRPELMKLVEEFYRAYRALAERYNHATGELKHAHQTIAKAFPDQVPFELIDDSPSKPRDPPHTPPERKFPVRALFDQVDFLDDNDDEVEGLKKALADVAAEKEEVLLEYQRCLARLSDLERELDNAQRESKALDEKVNRAEVEYLEKISNLEAMVSKVEEDTKGVNTRAMEAVNEAQTLKDEISRIELEKKLLLKQAQRAENEVSKLKKSVADLQREKDAFALKYKCCLETISKLERELSIAKDEVKRLNKDVLIGSIKLKTAEEKSSSLEMSNLSLRNEAENLVQKISEKDLELSIKQDELENLQTCLQDEHLSHARVESTLQTLQTLHSRSQDDRTALKLELENVFHMLKDLEVSKIGLEEEIRSLTESNLAMENTKNEVISLREIKERLETEVLHHVERSDSLQKEISCLKEEINGLTMSYNDLVEQVELVGLNPKCFSSSVKSLQDEKEVLSKKIEDMQDLLTKKFVQESSISDMNDELANVRENVKAWQETCQFLNVEKSTLLSEKVSLLSQLHAITESMHKLLENNAVLENSLSTAKIELEGLREKSKGLEEICELLKNERSHLLSERGSLVIKLENVESRLKSLEEKYTTLEKENKAVHSRVEELKISLSVEKQERTSFDVQSGARFSGLENQICLLKEENMWKKKEFEAELERSFKAQFEISILQKFIKDMEEKNYSLIIECQKHVEASKLAEKLISELENGSLEQQVESELLLDEIERLRLSLYQVFRAVDNVDPDEKIENEETFVGHILESIEDMKCSISAHEDNKQQLLVENSVLLTLLEQVESKVMQIESQKMYFEEEFKAMSEKHAMEKNEKDELVELSRKLKSDGVVLEAELESLCIKQVDSHESYNALYESYSQVKRDNENLLRKLDMFNDAAILENLEVSNRSEILRSFVEEKITEVKSLLEDLNRQHVINGNLEKETRVLSEKLNLQEAENLVLKDAVFRLEREKQGMREYNVRMKRDILQTEGKLDEAETLNSKLITNFQESLWKNGTLENNILRLSENKTNLETELGLLHQKNNEFEEFCFDLQISSSVNEVLFKNKVHELNGAYRILEKENASKICSMESEIKELKSRLHAYAPVVAALKDDITFLEHNALLQTKLKATLNQEAGFADNHSRSSSEKLLEDESLISLQDLQMRIKAVGKSMEETNKPLSRRKLNSKIDNERSKSSRCLGRKKGGQGNELLAVTETPKLQKIKTKATEIRNAMLMKDIPLDQVSNRSLRKRGCNKTNGGEEDQMLELWEKTSEDLTIGESLRLSCKMTEKDMVYDQFDPPSTDSDAEKELGVDKMEVSRRITEPSREVSARRILERLTSDSQKLENLHITVENLRTKLETNKKSKKSKNVDFETVEEQLMEAEETVESLVELNGQLVKALEECPTPEVKASPPLKQAVKTRRRRITEQARKGSERIGRLQLEVQKIQYILLKMDEEKKSKVRGKFFKSKSIVLRDFIYSNNGKKQSGRRKKGALCGCFRPSTSRIGS
ncbi:hypothetical protein ABFX02_07G035000 [Erythranthe guttata]